MTTTHATAATVTTTSEKAIVLESVVVITRKPEKASSRLAELNARMNANPDRISRIAAANTSRLAGKNML